MVREKHVSGTHEIIDDICEKECEKEKILNSVSCFMTDRSATEQKANTILSCDIDHDISP